MLNERELGSYLPHATRSLFRLEMLPAYDVPVDRGDFPRYLAGEPGPDMERKGRWLDFLREQRAQGIDRHRVRLLRAPLSDYDRYACEWGYAYNVPAGDDTRVLDLAERSMPVEVVDHDFWLVDHERPVRMHYDDAGHFLGATVVELANCLDTRWRATLPGPGPSRSKHGGIGTRSTTALPDHSMASTGQDSADRDELGRSLYAARRAAGLGQVEAANRAGTSQNKVSTASTSTTAARSWSALGLAPRSWVSGTCPTTKNYSVSCSTSQCSTAAHGHCWVESPTITARSDLQAAPRNFTACACFPRSSIRAVIVGTEVAIAIITEPKDVCHHKLRFAG